MIKQLFGSKIAKFRIAEYRDLRINPTEPAFVSHSHWKFYSYPPLVFLKNRDEGNCAYLAFENFKARTKS